MDTITWLASICRAFTNLTFLVVDFELDRSRTNLNILLPKKLLYEKKQRNWCFFAFHTLYTNFVWQMRQHAATNHSSTLLRLEPFCFLKFLLFYWIYYWLNQNKASKQLSWWMTNINYETAFLVGMVTLEIILCVDIGVLLSKKVVI